MELLSLMPMKGPHAPRDSDLIDQDPIFPTTAALFKTSDKSHSLRFRTSLLLPINPHSALPDLWEKVKSHYANDVTFSNFADVNLSWDEAHLSLSWTSDIDVSGSCELTRSKAGQPSELIPLTKDSGII